MSDPIIDAIGRQDLACKLVALRTWAIAEERWKDPIHQPAYSAKLAELKKGWKR